MSVNERWLCSWSTPERAIPECWDGARSWATKGGGDVWRPTQMAPEKVGMGFSVTGQGPLAGLRRWVSLGLNFHPLRTEIQGRN